MSLFKQLLIAICLFLVVAFSGSFMVSLESSRTQYVNQLRSHAQDAATALALSLTPNIDDPAMVELLVSSIFDSGYYASIRVVDLATDKTIVERSGIPDNNGVPNWFVKLIGLEPAGGDALVSRGWEQAERSEKLRTESYQDNLTGLANRRYFEMQLNARVSNPEETNSGYLLLLRVKDLAGLNQRLGGQRTDQLLQAVGQQLLRQCAPYPETHNLVTRIRGGEFAVLAPGLMREEAVQLAQNLESTLLSLQATGASDVTPVAYIGLAPFSHGDAPQALLTLADQALAQAQAQGDTSWVCLDRSAAASVGDDHHAWHTLLDQALTQQRFQLYFQPVVASQDPQLVLHYKVLSRLQGEDGHPIPAGRFLPWLERFGWSARLDRLMLEQVLKQMSSHTENLALNLSAATLQDTQALNRIYDLLRQHSNLGPRLTLEIGEEQLPEQPVLEQMTQRLRELGFSLSLQRFGGRFSMIGNLARLGLAYLKIDGSYIRAIDQESDKRLFIEAIQRAAHSIDLPLIAERVETEGELKVIREMGIFGVQGQLFGEPAPWK